MNKTEIKREPLTPFLLASYLDRYGLDFFKKLQNYSSCRVVLINGGNETVVPAKILSFGFSSMMLYVQIEGREPEHVSVFNCWDFVI